MKTDEIKRRLLNLEQRSALEDALCIVRFPDGSRGKVSVNEWYDHRREWEWVDIVKDSDFESKCPAPFYFMAHDLFEKSIERDLRSGISPDNPEIIRKQAELEKYRKVLIGE